MRYKAYCLLRQPFRWGVFRHLGAETLASSQSLPPPAPLSSAHATQPTPINVLQHNPLPSPTQNQLLTPFSLSATSASASPSELKQTGASPSPTYFPSPIPIPILSILGISLVQQYLKKASKFSKITLGMRICIPPQPSLSTETSRCSQPAYLPPSYLAIHLESTPCNKVGVERHQHTINAMRNAV